MLQVDRLSKYRGGLECPDDKMQGGMYNVLIAWLIIFREDEFTVSFKELKVFLSGVA